MRSSREFTQGKLLFADVSVKLVGSNLSGESSKIFLFGQFDSCRWDQLGRPEATLTKYQTTLRITEKQTCRLERMQIL